MKKTRKIKVAFYKKSKSTFGSIIRFQQNQLQGLDWKHSQYSHAEIVFCELRNEEIIAIRDSGNVQYSALVSAGEAKIHGTFASVPKVSFLGNPIENRYPKKATYFFSSSETDGGVRFKSIIPKKEHWDFVEIEVTEEEYKKMLEKAISLNGKKYGWAGIFFAQFLNKNFSGKDSYFCSQIVSIILSAGFGNDFCSIFYAKYTHFINPAKLHKRLLEFIKWT